MAYQAKYSKILTKKFLIKEYLIKQTSTTKIAKKVSCSSGTVLSYLLKNKIKIRTISEAIKFLYIYPKNHPFFGKHHSKETKKKIAKTKKGKRSGNYKDGRTLKQYYCFDCKKEIGINSGFYGSGLCRPCAQKGNNSGKNNWNWQGGKSFEEYGQEFDNALKELVRCRDHYKCQECGCSQVENGRQLDVHHINYNKQNNNINNLIALCMKCHTKTGINRKYWNSYFKEKKNEL